VQPAGRGQCWRELAAYQELQEQQRARSVSGRLSSLLRVAGVPLWNVLVSTFVPKCCCANVLIFAYKVVLPAHLQPPS
jgi:hypothetical protein